MKAIYKKELKSYFTSMMGYVYVAFVLLMVGIYFIAYNINGGYPLIGYSLSTVTFLFLILVPLLTMRALSEEQKNKTDQLLYTSPISIFQIVLGKYLALLTVFFIPILVICTFPLIMGRYGKLDYGMSYLAIFGFFLLGAAYIAVGLFISSITESQIIAGVTYLITGISSFLSNTAITSLIAFTILTILLCLGYYIMTKNIILSVGLFIIAEGILFALYIGKKTIFEGGFAKVLNTLDLASASNNMIQNGILDISSIIYYLSVIGLFLFFTVQSIQKRRWS